MKGYLKLPLMAVEGVLPTAAVAAAALLLFLLGLPRWGWTLLALALAVALFFRDPERRSQAGEGEVLSPADGRVVALDRVTEERYLNGEALRISVFMSIFNVHVNRAPFSARVESVEHVPGGFAMAHLDDASLRNERTEILLRDGKDRLSLLVQVAGLVARRIVCRLEAGDRVRRGQRFGLIRFGSRLDLYLPVETTPRVRPGQRVRCGETVLGELP